MAGSTARDEDDGNRFTCGYEDPGTRAGCFETATKCLVTTEGREIFACDRHARDLMVSGVAEEKPKKGGFS